MRYRKPFTLIKREDVWYYRTYDEYGRRTTKRSTGQTNKTLAERYCFGLASKGELVPVKDTLFSAYASDWWLWDRCEYIKGKLARSEPTKPAISQQHAFDMRKTLGRHILPAFRDRKLSEITAPQIEHWMFSLRDKGLSPKRINNVASCLRVMLSETKRKGLITINPFDVVEPFAAGSKERGILTIDEVRKLFDPQAIEQIWKGHLLSIEQHLTTVRIHRPQISHTSLRSAAVTPVATSSELEHEILGFQPDSYRYSSKKLSSSA